MINIKLLILMLLLGKLGQGFDLNKRWINTSGWAKPNLSKLTLIKEETVKDRFIKEITIKTFEKKKYECVWKSNKVLPGYKTSQKIEIANIFLVEAYECKELNCSPVYLMGLDVIHDRSLEYGDLITSTHVILADIDNDGIYESQFDGSYEKIKPGSFIPGLMNYIISSIIQKESQEKTVCLAKK